MKSEPKAFASLSSGLLARKGAARPAMRPQGFGQSGAGLEDLGWNDMGFEAPKPTAATLRDEGHDGFGEEIVALPSRNPLAGLSPVQSPVHSQQAEIADRFVSSSDDEFEEDVDDTAELYEPEPEPEALVAEPIAAAPEPIVFLPEPVAFVPEPETAAEPTADHENVVPFGAPVPQVIAPARRRAATPRSAPGSKAKAAFTLRLDPDRHLKLRLACAIGGRSAQQLVTDALDALLAGMPELDAMAAKANRKG